MAKKKTAAKRTTAKPNTATKQVSVSDSVSVTDTPVTTSATEKHARSRENRNVTSVNTGEGYKELGNLQASDGEGKAYVEDKPTYECQNKRPNGDTCLQELEKAKENPQRFTQEQQKVILAGDNLCEYCIEQE